MKFGVCVGTDIEKMKLAKETGYDYAESHCQEIAKAEYAHLEKMKAVGLPVFFANCFIGMRIVGDEADQAKIREYVETLFEKAAFLGMECLVFGSSGARRIPEGMSLEEGRNQIVDFLKNQVASVAEKYGITVAIEPLRPEECNAINTIADGVEIAKRVNSPRVKVLADIAHMFVQGEDSSILRDYEGWIIHAHTSNPDPDPSLGKKRIYPAKGDAFSQADFIENLKAIGVECCSIEAEVIDFEADLKNSYEILSALR